MFLLLFMLLKTPSRLESLAEIKDFSPLAKEGSFPAFTPFRMELNGLGVARLKRTAAEG